MVQYTGGSGLIDLVAPYPQGSPAQRLGVDRRTATANINRELLPADLQRYADEYDARLNPAERQAAREKRIAEDKAVDLEGKQAAVNALLAGGAVPDGFTVVQHAGNPTAQTSIGLTFGDGCHVMVRTQDVEALASHGFRPVAYPG